METETAVRRACFPRSAQICFRRRFIADGTMMADSSARPRGVPLARRLSGVVVTLLLALQSSLGRAENRPRWRARYRRLLPFHVARNAARSLGFSKADWDDWVGDGKASPSLGPYMPSDPKSMYPDDWQGWDDWLGVPRPYDEARGEVHRLGLRTQQAWWEMVENEPELLEELRIPARPHLYYPSRGTKWLGYDDWLGRGEQVLYPPRAGIGGGSNDCDSNADSNATDDGDTESDDAEDDGYPSATA